jgi:hypothetical protein
MLRAAMAVAAIAMSPSSVAGIADGLQLYYPFSGDAQDASGNGHDGSVKDALLATDRHGSPDAAYQFHVPSAMIVTPYSAALEPAQALTVVSWIKVDEPLVRGRIVDDSAWVDGRSRGYYMAIRAGHGKRFVELCLSAKNGRNCAWMYVHKKEQRGWHFYVSTFDSTGTSLYFDGQSRSYFSIGSPMLPATHDFAVGNNSEGTAPFDGSLDEVRIYDRALSQEEILELYQLGLQQTKHTR